MDIWSGRKLFKCPILDYSSGIIIIEKNELWLVVDESNCYVFDLTNFQTKSTMDNYIASYFDEIGWKYFIQHDTIKIFNDN